MKYKVSSVYPCTLGATFTLPPSPSEIRTILCEKAFTSTKGLVKCAKQPACLRPQCVLGNGEDEGGRYALSTLGPMCQPRGDGCRAIREGEGVRCSCSLPLPRLAPYIPVLTPVSLSTGSSSICRTLCPCPSVAVVVVPVVMAAVAALWLHQPIRVLSAPPWRLLLRCVNDALRGPCSVCDVSREQERGRLQMIPRLATLLPHSCLLPLQIPRAPGALHPRPYSRITQQRQQLHLQDAVSMPVGGRRGGAGGDGGGGGGAVAAPADPRPLRAAVAAAPPVRT